MPFSQATITDAFALRSGADLLVKWTSTSPPGTLFQVYLDRELAWSGSARSCVLPYPTTPGGQSIEVDVGTVGPSEADLDFSGSLPSPAWANRARLTWLGGSFEAPVIGLGGFHVYRGPTAGAAVSYTTPVATITAYPQGFVIDGAGVGPAGRGGAGQAAGKYQWESDPLTGGSWHFGVKAFDLHGVESTPQETVVTITAPPNPPAPNPAGLRLTVSGYNPTTRVPTLAWLASPP